MNGKEPPTALEVLAHYEAMAKLGHLSPRQVVLLRALRVLAVVEDVTKTPETFRAWAEELEVRRYGDTAMLSRTAAFLRRLAQASEGE